MMAVATDKNKEVQYKDYVHFLDSYKTKRHINRNESDDSSVNSLNSSLNSSMAEINELPIKSFNEYLQDYTNKKFQPVQPKLKNDDYKNKTVKTEIVIQVNNDRKNRVNETPKSQFQQIQMKFNKQNGSNVHKNETVIKHNNETVQPISKIINELKCNSRQEHDVQTKIKSELNGNQSFVYNNKQKLFAHLNHTNGNESDNKDTSIKIIPKKTDNDASTIFIEKEKEIIEKKENSLNNKVETPIPSPPPLPPITPQNHSTPKSVIVINKPNGLQSKSSTLPRMVNYKNSHPSQRNNDVVDAPVINKNDPRVKKAVYGALRNMYGAYHEKANEYISTIPRNRVKKGNGLDSIIDSIAAQGGLEKLCGRAKVEAD